MSQSIPTGYIPRAKCFEQANAGHPGNFFCLIPCPGAKNYCRIPRGFYFVVSIGIATYSIIINVALVIEATE